MSAPAKVDINNGKFVRIANKLHEGTYAYDFTLREVRVIGCVIRFSYGFNRKYTKEGLTVAKIARATGLRHDKASDALKTLIENRVILFENGLWTMNTRMGQWNVEKVGKDVKVSENCPETGNPKRGINEDLPESAYPETGHKDTPKRGINIPQNGALDTRVEPYTEGIVEGPKDSKDSKDNIPPPTPSPEKSDSENENSEGGGGGVSEQAQGPLAWLPSADRNRYLAGNEQILQKLSPGGLSSTMRKAMNQFLSVRTPACCPAAPRLSVGMTWAQVLTGHLKVGVEETQEARASPGHGIKNPALMAISRANALLGDTIRKFETEFHPNESENPQ